MRDDTLVDGALSPDGKYLAYADDSGIHLKLMATGETRKVPVPDELERAGSHWWIGDWFPDGTRFVVTSLQRWWNQGPHSIWVVSVLGSPPRKLREDAAVGAVSPDGSQIAFLTGRWALGPREIWVMGANGDGAHRIYSVDERSAMHFLRWSADGHRLAYWKSHETPERSIESIDLNGGPATVVYSNPGLHDYCWLPDGRVLFSLEEPTAQFALRRSCNLWEIKVDGHTGRPMNRPRRITNWAGFQIDQLVLSDLSQRNIVWDGPNAPSPFSLKGHGTEIVAFNEAIDRLA
jgi:Tol biopolymer transport system component